MKTILFSLCLLLHSFGVNAQHNHQSASGNGSKDKPVKSLSPHTSAMAMINGAHVHIDYSSPSVRDRIIFGGLVGYNTVWQAGAHRATWLETDRDLVLEGKKLPAGKYAFFVVPGKEEWKVILNSRWDQHGKDEFNEEENVLEIKVKPIMLDRIQETLEYNVEKKGEKKGVISLAWEKVRIELPFEVVAKK